jgi:DNA-binding transcriptional ArsR family regulator
MKAYPHPELDRLPLATVMQALSDPCRILIVRTLMEADDRELACGEFDLGVSKATCSHHFDVLRSAGVIASRVEGTRCMTSLRRDEIESRFPGLLHLVAGELPTKTGRTR